MKFPKFRRPSGSEIIEAIAIGIIGGATASVIALASKKIADVGDLLGFVGAAVGAGLAVIGAIYVDDRRRRNESTEGAASLREVIKGFIAMVDVAVDQIPDRATPRETFVALEIVSDRFESVRRYIGFMHSRPFIKPNAHHILYWFESDTAKIFKTVESVDLENIDHDMFQKSANGYLQSIRGMAEMILEEI